MTLLKRDKPPIEQLKHAAIEAAVGALANEKASTEDKPALTGVRAVATGALLYTAGRAAFKAQRLLREQFFSNQAGDEQASRARDAREERARRDHKFADDVRSDEEPETTEADGPDASDEQHEQMPRATEQDKPEAYEEDEQQSEAAHRDDLHNDESDDGDDQRGHETSNDERGAGGAGPSGDAEQQQERGQDFAEPGAVERSGKDAGEPDDESRSKTPTPWPKRKPLQRGAPKNVPQPSLKLPQQRWTLRSRAGPNPRP
jgi:hypothetical protein